jgi:NSS family neurotransmitter:Na+ symporter
MIILATPAALGMNVWSGVHFGAHIGSIDALEDFIVSQNLLPIGSMLFLLFCTIKKGWGWEGFTAEADAGDGVKFPKNKVVKFYLRFIAPIIILVVFIAGYFDIFGAK